ncbi:hypothetical protein Bpfe_020157 [Biomphalaria pfeifferi]|uniref:Uncharacterized protein n=1 Tax=Biomphalaria pfeifferi TaxID=112525 RepID=A0AAD8F563_BIOPF|nr:hypothetical protein Bpfe_020157 [Biomphalaria pfeifferi]
MYHLAPTPDATSQGRLPNFPNPWYASVLTHIPITFVTRGDYYSSHSMGRRLKMIDVWEPTDIRNIQKLLTDVYIKAYKRKVEGRSRDQLVWVTGNGGSQVVV